MLDPRLRLRRGGLRGGLPSAMDTASGGGTTVRVGGVTQTDYLKAHSLTLRLNSFDFALVNPAVVPVIGDMVYLLEPAWDGQVVSVTHADVKAGTTKIYSIVATNADETVASAAPFGWSDVADNVSTFGYADLTITTSKNTTGNATRGTFTTWQQGLWPGMTFALTSANFGLSGQTYSVSNVTVTWPAKNTTPVFSIEFGDALIGLTEVALDTGGLSTEADGTTSLVDPFGTLIFNSGSGFGAGWRRFLSSGVYNGDFVSGPAAPGQVISNVTNILPYWSFVRIGGTAVNMTWVSDPANASGHALSAAMVAGVADDDACIEQVIPVNGSQSRSFTYLARCAFKTGAAVDASEVYVTLDYLRADGATTTGVSATNSATLTSIGANAVKDVRPWANSNLAIPADAYWLRVRAGYRRAALAVGTVGAGVSLCEVTVLPGATHVLMPESVDPVTWGSSYIRQSDGELNMQANYTGPTGTSPQIQLYGATGIIKISPTSTGTVHLNGPVKTGSTAFPGSPATNDMFYRTDYGIWFYYDGAAWQVTPAFIGCRVYNVAAQSVSAATETTLTFDTEEYDTGGLHSTSSNTGRFTVPAGYAGKWRFTLHHWAGGLQGVSYVFLRLNGTTALKGTELDWTAPGDYGTELSATLLLAAADYVEVRAYRTTGTTIGGANAIAEAVEFQLIALTGI